MSVFPFIDYLQGLKPIPDFVGQNPTETVRGNNRKHKKRRKSKNRR